MSTLGRPGLGGPLEHELARLKKEWWWFVLLGGLLVVGGAVAITHATVATAVALKLFGVLLVIGGVAQIVASFWTGKWSGFLLSLLVGILYSVVGFMMLARTLEASLALTLLMGAFFLVGGIFRAVASITLRFPNWGWPLLSGIVSAFLGMLVLAEWPESSLFFIGLCIGIDMIFTGWAWAMLGVDLHNSPDIVA
jgi:uncharacterized membrane protein HdeD (DUF308 family)